MPVYEEKELVNGQKRWYIRTYTVGSNGKKKQITRHNKLWIGRDGYWLAYQEESQLKNKKIDKFEKISLDDLANKYFEYVKANLKPSSVQKNIDNYNCYIHPIIGFKNVTDLENKDILELHKYLDNYQKVIKSKNAKRKSGSYALSLRFKQSIHITLNAILNFGCKYYNLEKNVAKIVGNFKNIKGVSKNELNFLTISEFKHFINYEKNEIYKDFFLILFYTGMRRGELLALTIKDIDFDKNELYINKSLNPKNGKEATVPKTNKSNRKIKMLNIVKNTLLKYKNTQKKYIFGLENIKLTTLQKKCDNNCKSAGIEKNIRIHDFRHSFASMCIFKGVPIEIISEYLGHENISTTLNTYSHLYPNSQEKLVAILDEKPIEIKLDNQQELIDSIMSFISINLLKGKSVEEITNFLSKTNSDYFLKQDQKQDQ